MYYNDHTTKIYLFIFIFILEIVHIKCWFNSENIVLDMRYRITIGIWGIKEVIILIYLYTNISFVRARSFQLNF